MREYFIPTKKNNYTAHLINRKALLVYLVTLLAFNFVLSSLGLLAASADIGFSDVVELHNEQRSKEGLSHLRVNNDLVVSATEKAEAMLKNDCWAHYCPEGTSPWKFFDDAGYYYLYAGENLAEGFNDPEEVMNAWMNSPTHKENVVNPDFKEIGIGFAYGSFQGRSNNTIIVVHFGTKPTESAVFAASDVEDINLDKNYLISINNPTESSTIQNNPVVDIQGKVEPVNSTVELQINSNSEGRVIANGENYTFREELVDGNYSIQTKIVDESTNIFMADSNTVSVQVDTILPQLYSHTLFVGKNENSLRIEFQLSEEATVSVVGEDLSFSSLPDNFWFTTLHIDTLKNKDQLELSLIDNAGNESIITLNTTQLLFDAEKNLLDDSEISASSILGSRIIAPFIGSFTQSDAREILAYVFIGYLVLLLSIDFVMLAKTNVLEKIHRKSHISIAILLATFIFLHLGGFGGDILVGLSG